MVDWISRIKPKIQALVGAKKDTPDHLWVHCQACGKSIFHREFADNLFVCRYCGYHAFFPVSERFASLFDSGIYQRIATPTPVVDPLKFKDKKRYTDRLSSAEKSSNEKDSVSLATGLIERFPTVVAAFSFDFMAGSMGTTAGSTIVKGMQTAIQSSCPFVIFTTSGGARMQEGIFSLMQMPRTVACLLELKEKKLPYIVVLTNPTTGGVSASFAMLGDIHLAEPQATICFAGRRVIEQTVREKLPSNFQTSEYVKERGMIDHIVHRDRMKSTLARIFSLLIPRSRSLS